MGSLRILAVLAVLGPAAPAAAQLAGAADQFQLDLLRAQQEAAQRRAVDQANQLSALEARLRAEQAVLDLRLQRGDVGPPPVPALRYEPPAGSAPAAARYPSIPDSALADSNRRVQAAAGNRR
jgi:hypothetical protein